MDFGIDKYHLLIMLDSIMVSISCAARIYLAVAGGILGKLNQTETLHLTDQIFPYSTEYDATMLAQRL